MDEALRVDSRHTWDLDPSQARALQSELAREVDTVTPLGTCSLIAAVDVSFDRGAKDLFAAVLVVKAGSFEVVETIGVTGPAAFPYIPGLLSFREAPALIEAFRKLKTTPDAVICDGQGIAHPRSLGIASHLGLWLGLPTIGCAKSHLFGTFDEPGPNRGDRSPIRGHDGAVIGAVLRSRSKVKPLFVSPGHLCDVEGAVRLVMETTGRLRIPQPVRLAHAEVNRLRRAAKGAT